MITTKDITDQARFLRNASPQTFEAFIAAFAKYSADMTAILIKTNTTENLLVAQGHVQMCVKILDALKEANKDG